MTAAKGREDVEGDEHSAYEIAGRRNKGNSEMCNLEVMIYFVRRGVSQDREICDEVQEKHDTRSY